jgi:DNA-binding transcriptional ArsR family regulator
MIDPCSREVFDKYYMHNLLGVSITEEKLAEKLFLSRPTIHKNLEILDKGGLIDIEELETKKGGSKQVPQRVYILGRWVSEIDLKGEEKVREYLYAFNLLKSDIFTINQAVDEHTV